MEVIGDRGGDSTTGAMWGAPFLQCNVYAQIQINHQYLIRSYVDGDNETHRPIHHSLEQYTPFLLQTRTRVSKPSPRIRGSNNFYNQNTDALNREEEAKRLHGGHSA